GGSFLCPRVSFPWSIHSRWDCATERTERAQRTERTETQLTHHCLCSLRPLRSLRPLCCRTSSVPFAPPCRPHRASGMILSSALPATSRESHPCTARTPRHYGQLSRSGTGEPYPSSERNRFSIPGPTLSRLGRG